MGVVGHRAGDLGPPKPPNLGRVAPDVQTFRTPGRKPRRRTLIELSHRRPEMRFCSRAGAPRAGWLVVKIPPRHPSAPPRARRHRRILAALAGDPTVRISSLAAEFGVSAETVRRDVE